MDIIKHNNKRQSGGAVLTAASSKWDVKRTFALFTAVIFILVAVVSGTMFYIYSRNAAQQTVEDDLIQAGDVTKLRLGTAVNGDLALVIKLADSPAITGFFQNPENAELREDALALFGEYREAFDTHDLFWMMSSDMIFHMNEDAYWVDESLPENYWYSLTVNETELYNFNVNYNPDLDKIALWVNAPVFADGKAVGMLGTSIDLTAFGTEVYSNIDDRIELYLYAKSGKITIAEDTRLLVDAAYIDGVYENLPTETSAFSRGDKFFVVDYTADLDWYLLACREITLADTFGNDVTLIFCVMLGVLALFVLSANILVRRLADVIDAKERTLLEETLSAERERLNSQAKSEFLSRMSHEIRTPMNAVIGMTELALKSGDFQKSKDYMKNVSDSAKRLLGLINDVLDISKIESGKIELSFADFNFDEMLKTCVGNIRAQADAKNINLSVARNYQFDRLINGDELRVSQIIINLLSNAVKFTQNDGIVTVMTDVAEAEGEHRLIVSVRDNGIGIAPKNLSKVFESFEQTDASITREYGGSGLGLAICKSLAEIMNGTLTVRSELGQGSVFTLEMPFTFGGKITDETETDTLGAIDLSGRRILLAEDIAVNRLIVTALLEDTGVEIDEAENGAEAVDMAEKNRYDLILMDMQMPVMDGITATRLIRRFNPDVPILAMTANAFNEDAEKCLNAGMNAHIAKPLDSGLFIKMLVKYTGGVRNA